MSFEESSNPIPLILRNSRQNTLSSLHISAQDRALIFDHGQRQAIAVDIHVFIGNVNPVMSGHVTEQEDVLVEMVDGMRLITDDVVESVRRVGVDETVTDPFGGLNTALYSSNVSHVSPLID